MTMRVNGGGPSAYEAAKTTNASAAQKNDAVPAERVEAPAYRVEISARGRDESDGEYIARLMRSTKRYDGEIKAGSMEEFYTSWRAKQKELTERAAEKNRDVLISPEPYSDELYWKGDQILGINVYAEHWAEKEGVINPLYAEADEHFESYRNVLDKVRAGGTSVFRAYNLKFAGMAALANTSYADEELSKRIARGHTTVEEYTRAKSYANEANSKTAQVSLLQSILVRRRRSLPRGFVTSIMVRLRTSVSRNWISWRVIRKRVTCGFKRHKARTRTMQRSCQRSSSQVVTIPPQPIRSFLVD